ncbi:MAG: DUF4011 domain-containing protein, partial [Deltaproteobacteria bacterium]|nr:DUF4011 domain-containing protein [Deltaproteobacteria bacterium]
MINVADQIEHERTKLLDLSLRNRLLNHKPTKMRTIEIEGRDIKRVYDILVIDQKQMRFRAAKKIENLVSPDKPKEKSLIPAITQENIPDSKPNSEISKERTDQYLDTPYDPDNLQRKLSFAAQTSKSIIEEQGYTILFFALGFLEWHDPNSPDTFVKAPLILIPVALKRGEIRESYKIVWIGDDVIGNTSLREYLKELNVELPDYETQEDKDDIRGFFDKVRASVKKYPKWNIKEEMCLDFFDFKKFVMYKDLDAKEWPGGLSPSSHPLINAIYNRDPSAPAFSGFVEDDVDKKIRAESVYHMMDADSSQIAVIQDIKAGRNLVVQGPPGTGKSQTIVNAIADLLAEGKTVLFVSEKMAALDVVKSRLDSVGIGEFCLKLHKENATKTEFHRQLGKTLALKKTITEADISEKLSELDELKKRLNGYLTALYTPVGRRQLTPFSLMGMNQKIQKHFSSVNREMVQFCFTDAENISPDEWRIALNSLSSLYPALSRVKLVEQHPWYGCRPGVYLPQSDESSLRQIIHNTTESFFHLQEKIYTLAEATGLSLPNNLDELKDALEATNLFISPDPVDRKILTGEAWNRPNEQADYLITKIGNFQRMEAEILRKFDSRILEKDIGGFLEEFQPLTEKFTLLKMFNSRYKNLRKDAILLYRASAPHKDHEILADLEYARQAIDERTRIRLYYESGVSLFGSLWQSERSDVARLRDFSSWIILFRRNLIEQIFTERTVEMMSQGVSPDGIRQAAEECSDAFQKYIQQRYSLFQKTGFSCERRFSQKEGAVKFSKIQLLLSLWNENLERLSEWSQYELLSEECQKTPAGQFVRIIESNNIPPDDILPTFEGNYVNSLLKNVISERSELGKFFGETHERQIQLFRDLDKTIITQNKLRVLAKLGPGIPDIEQESTPHSKLGILKAESKKKRGGLPIRQIMSTIGDVIQKITPCFMMGPLSVAKFLDPKVISFDVVIFDEASQVRPEDALGALLRGKQAVIIGDSKQLPPTMFFDKMVEDIYDDTEDISDLLTDMESILDLCVISFGSKMLHWHYRSLHESLIALSNSEFYENKLFVYPSPLRRSEELGLKFVHLPDSVYDKGINRIEAQTVAKAVFEHYRKYPEKTLGVGTFSVRQQQAIDDEIKRLRYQNLDLEKNFQDDQPEKFFVKNLETIQGDERDIIFISIGYGKDANKKFAMQFGPLNKVGGERRLNVLITRARERCVVFSNFTSLELRYEGLKGSGVRIL